MDTKKLEGEVIKEELNNLEKKMIEKASIEYINQGKPIIKISLSDIVAKKLNEKLICLRKDKK